MSLANAIKGVVLRPRRIVLYGVHGVGKSTWAANAPSPFFLATEDGANDIGVERTPLIRSLGEFNSWVSDLLTDTHSYKTLVIDTADWLEKLIWAAVAQDEGKSHIEEIGYGKGYKKASLKWEFVLSSLEHLRARKNMAIIILAHSKQARVEPPDGDPYTRYAPDLHDIASTLLQEWADEVLFCNFVTHTVAKEGNFGRKHTIGVGGKVRKVYTEGSSAFSAKRRLMLPDELPMQWDAYANAVKAARPKKGDVLEQPKGDIEGVVKDGSSKVKEEVTTNGE